MAVARFWSMMMMISSNFVQYPIMLCVNVSNVILSWPSQAVTMIHIQKCEQMQRCFCSQTTSEIILLEKVKNISKWILLKSYKIRYEHFANIYAHLHPIHDFSKKPGQFQCLTCVPLALDQSFLKLYVNRQHRQFSMKYSNTSDCNSSPLIFWFFSDFS